jgi:hypothetical protein
MLCLAEDGALPSDDETLTKNQFLEFVIEVVDCMDTSECVLCGINTSGIGEYYMVNDDLWRKYGAYDEGMLCIGCLEERMGRSLVSVDFTDCQVNTDEEHNRSMRLIDRLSRDCGAVSTAVADRFDGEVT